MDPTEYLRRFVRALLQEDSQEAREAHAALVRWRALGGFDPDWSICSERQFRSFNPRTGRIE